MRVKINLDDPKAKALVAYLQSLDYVTFEQDYEISETLTSEAKETKAEYRNDRNEDEEDYEIPEWHKEIVRKSLAEYKKNPENFVTMDELKKNLNIK
jgi:hypothetical protein